MRRSGRQYTSEVYLFGTRSIGCQTRLLKPQLGEQKFEESFTTWEPQLSKYEQGNNALLPDATNIAILLNGTKEALQKHLQLQAGNINTYAQIRSLVIASSLNDYKRSHQAATVKGPDAPTTPRLNQMFTTKMKAPKTFRSTFLKISW